MLKIGILGCGKIAQVRHLPEYASIDDVELAGYFDLDAGRAAETAAYYGGKVYNTWQELICDRNLDAVSICTANHVHAQMSIAALEAGRHVLCEKPMAVTLSECEAMVDAAERSGKFLMIGQNQRLTKAHIQAQKLLKEGAVGDIISFRTSFGHSGPETWSIEKSESTWFFDKSRATMGAMADLGVHKTDLIHFLTGQYIVKTKANLATLNKCDKSGNLIQVDDNAHCIYTLSGGAAGTMSVSWTYYGPEDNSTIIYGTQGILHIYNDPHYAIRLFRKDGESILYDIENIQTNDNQTRSGVIDAFVTSLRSNQPPQISGKEVLPAMRVIFASIESSQKDIAICIDHG